MTAKPKLTSLEGRLIEAINKNRLAVNRLYTASEIAKAMGRKSIVMSSLQLKLAECRSKYRVRKTAKTTKTDKKHIACKLYQITCQASI